MVSAASVAAWGRFKAPADPSEDLVLLELVIDAAELYIRENYVLADELTLTATEELAIIMQCARLWKRRDTPEGRSAFGGDIAVTITSLDPDVDALLVPRVGFA